MITDKTCFQKQKNTFPQSSIQGKECGLETDLYSYYLHHPSNLGHDPWHYVPVPSCEYMVQVPRDETQCSFGFVRCKSSSVYVHNYLPIVATRVITQCSCMFQIIKSLWWGGEGGTSIVFITPSL